MCDLDAEPARTIVVAVDGSAPSREAGRFAVELAHDLGARLHIIHVIDAAVTDAAMESAAVWPPAMSAVQDAAREIVGLTAREADRRQVPKRVRLIEGFDAAEAIVGEAAAHHAIFIVVGSHGRTGLKRVVLGSVAERVVRSADRPVLVYRQRPRARTRRGAVSREGKPVAAPVG